MQNRKKKLSDELTIITNEIVRIRDNHRCQLTGKPLRTGGEVHHIYGKKANPNLRFDYFNLLLLSKESHHKFHNERDKYLDWFKNKYPYRYEFLLAIKNNNMNYKEYQLKEMIKVRKEILKQWSKYEEKI